MRVREASEETKPQQVTECVNALWHGDELLLLSRRGGQLHQRRVPAPYACYLRKSEVKPELERSLRSSRHVRGFHETGEWVRVDWHDRQALLAAAAKGGWFERYNVSTYEADLHPVRRYMADNAVRIQAPRRCYLDIETDSRVPFSRKEEARVLCWALVDDAGERVLGMLQEDSDEAELELLEDLLDELREYDQVCGWFLDRFDRPVIQARAQLHGSRIEFKRWLWLDQLELYRKMNMHAAESGDEKTSLALEAVARSLKLAVGKLPVDAGKTWEMWSAGGEQRELLGRYCLRDADLLVAIEAKTGFIDLQLTLSQACSTFPDTSGSNSTSLIDGFLLGLGRESGIHFRTKVWAEGVEQFEGAFVLDPTRKGILRNVHVADFAALYPSIIETWNMSPETFQPDVVLEDSASRPLYLLHAPIKERALPEGMCRTPTKKAFLVEPMGLLPIAIGKLRSLRAASNKRKAELTPGTPEWHDADRSSTAYKVAANAFYGVVGSPFSRFFERHIAEGITQCGVWLIKETIRAAEDRGMAVIYGDTDSVFVQGATENEFREFVAWCNAELYPKLLAEMGCKRNEIKLAYEKEFDRIVFVSAKRYAGSYRHYKGTPAGADSEPEVKGLEYKRGDSSVLTRRFQKEVIDLLMHGEESAEGFIPAVQQWRERVVHGELELSDFLVSKKLAKPLETYVRKRKKDNTLAKQPPHVEVARRLKALGHDVGEGVRIEYVVVDGSKGQQVCARHEWQPGMEDRFYLWEKLVFPPTLRVLQSALPGHPWRDYLKVRPKVERKTKDKPAVKPRPNADTGQGTLF